MKGGGGERCENGIRDGLMVESDEVVGTGHAWRSMEEWTGQVYGRK